MRLGRWVGVDQLSPWIHHGTWWPTESLGKVCVGSQSAYEEPPKAAVLSKVRRKGCPAQDTGRVTEMWIASDTYRADGQRCCWTPYSAWDWNDPVYHIKCPGRESLSWHLVVGTLDTAWSFCGQINVKNAAYCTLLFRFITHWSTLVSLRNPAEIKLCDCI